jgi:hypothetical protein
MAPAPGDRAAGARGNRHDEPLFRPIEFEIDVEKRRARAAILGVIEATGQPIVSPVTGEEHRVRIDIPNGIGFELAEIGCGTARATGTVELDLDDSYGQFNVLRHSGPAWSTPGAEPAAVRPGRVDPAARTAGLLPAAIASDRRDPQRRSAAHPMRDTGRRRDGSD